MIVTVTLAAAVFELLLSLPVLLLFSSDLTVESLLGEMATVLWDGGLEGLSLSLPMALATVLLFRDSRRLKRYGLAMLVIALAVAVLRWSWISPLAQFALEKQNALAAIAVGRRLAIIMFDLAACRFAAVRYRRKALAGALA